MKAYESNASWLGLLRSVNAAIRAVNSSPTMSDERAHRIRKELKKARASLRLLRCNLGKRTYRRENAVLRDASRVVSPLRDAKAQLDLLAALGKRFRKDITTDELGSIAAPLREDLERTRRRIRSDAPQIRRMVRSMRDSRERLRQSAAGSMAAGEARKGLRRVYAAARHAFDEARSNATSAALHEWRKKTKYLYNALGMIDRKRAHEVSPRVRRRADKLGDWLGEEQDLVVLSSELRRKIGSARLRGKLDRHIVQRRKKLAKKALRLGTKTYADGPRKVIHS